MVVERENGLAARELLKSAEHLTLWIQCKHCHHLVDLRVYEKHESKCKAKADDVS